MICGFALVPLVAACGGVRHGVEAAPATQICAAGSTQRAGADGVARAAFATRPLTAFRAPGRGVIARFGLRNLNGAPTAFGVLAQRVNASCRATWLHVQLPLRPNGATGWIRADHVRQVSLRTRIVVDLSERVVRFYRNGRLALRHVAAVGSPATPTPLGRYYVNQRLVPDDPSGPYGPGAIGISAFSPVLTGWAQGGPVAIHGTDAPWSIGRAVSNGCIRLPNDVLRRLFRETPTGTPVLIRR